MYLIYSDGSISCHINDRETLYEFAIMTEKEEGKTVVGVLKIKA